MKVLYATIVILSLTFFAAARRTNAAIKWFQHYSHNLNVDGWRWKHVKPLGKLVHKQRRHIIDSM